MELSSGRQAPFKYRLPLLMRVLWTHLYQNYSWRSERLCSALVNFFWRLFQCVCPFHDGWFMSAPARTALSVQQFLTQNGVTPTPHPPYSPDLAPEWLCFVSLDGKSPLRETFCRCPGGETRMAETWKGINVNKFKHCSEQWKKTSC